MSTVTDAMDDVTYPTDAKVLHDVLFDILQESLHDILEQCGMTVEDLKTLPCAVTLRCGVATWDVLTSHLLKLTGRRFVASLAPGHGGGGVIELDEDAAPAFGLVQQLMRLAVPERLSISEAQALARTLRYMGASTLSRGVVRYLRPMVCGPPKLPNREMLSWLATALQCDDVDNVLTCAIWFSCCDDNPPNLGAFHTLVCDDLRDGMQELLATAEDATDGLWASLLALRGAQHTCARVAAALPGGLPVAWLLRMAAVLLCDGDCDPAIASAAWVHELLGYLSRDTHSEPQNEEAICNSWLWNDHLRAFTELLDSSHLRGECSCRAAWRRAYCEALLGLVQVPGPNSPPHSVHRNTVVHRDTPSSFCVSFPMHNPFQPSYTDVPMWNFGGRPRWLRLSCSGASHSDGRDNYDYARLLWEARNGNHLGGSDDGGYFAQIGVEFMGLVLGTSEVDSEENGIQVHLAVGTYHDFERDLVKLLRDDPAVDVLCAKPLPRPLSSMVRHPDQVLRSGSKAPAPVPVQVFARTMWEEYEIWTEEFVVVYMTAW